MWKFLDWVLDFSWLYWFTSIAEKIASVSEDSKQMSKFWFLEKSEKKMKRILDHIKREPCQVVRRRNPVSSQVFYLKKYYFFMCTTHLNLIATVEDIVSDL